MIIYSKVTGIFYLVDEFCKEYSELVDKSLIGNKAKRPSIMSKSEIITLAIIFQLSGFRTFKHFYIFYVKTHMKDDFPVTVSYNRFTELMQQNLMATTLFLKTCCLGDCTGISFADSTPVRSSGSDLRLSGQTEKPIAEASSDSDIKAGDLKAESSQVKASSGADITVNTSKELIAKASSGGDIKYYGNPKKVEKNNSSAGSVKKK